MGRKNVLVSIRNKQDTFSIERYYKGQKLLLHYLVASSSQNQLK
ncbi:hypothetical protein B4119_2380 [Parageobacillus caldoxylosilyticus]|uniref:Uncharacterized protein n=1 Tax=Saccharococcus caldoxylosilyticus TaxID=81408 RepID=A0A150LVA4_9BACL|nr:hypothetical protein B4119_2380 [Parageobacillus caldoxylosilyticus]